MAGVGRSTGIYRCPRPESHLDVREPSADTATFWACRVTILIRHQRSLYGNEITHIGSASLHGQPRTCDLYVHCLGDLVVRGSALYLSCYDGVWCFDLSSGALTWNTTIERAHELCFLEGRVFAQAERSLHGLDLETGEQIWKIHRSGSYGFRLRPAVSGGSIFVHHAKDIWRIDAETGKATMKIKTAHLKASNDAPGTFNDLVVENDRIYTQLTNKKQQYFVESFDANTGKARHKPVPIAFAPDDRCVRGGWFERGVYYAVSSCEAHATGPRRHYGAQAEEDDFTGATVFCALELDPVRLTHHILDMPNGRVETPDGFRDHAMMNAETSNIVKIANTLWFSTQIISSEGTHRLFRYDLGSAKAPTPIASARHYDQLAVAGDRLLGVHRTETKAIVTLIDTDGTEAASASVPGEFLELGPLAVSDDKVFTTLLDDDDRVFLAEFRMK